MEFSGNPDAPAGGLARLGAPALVEVLFRNGLGLGEEREKRERFLAGGTNQREDFVDPGQEGGPPGRPGGGGMLFEDMAEALFRGSVLREKEDL